MLELCRATNRTILFITNHSKLPYSTTFLGSLDGVPGELHIYFKHYVPVGKSAVPRMSKFPSYETLEGFCLVGWWGFRKGGGNEEVFYDMLDDFPEHSRLIKDMYSIYKRESACLTL